ncbi:AI-2E family transporter [Inediibacterium massiliense]|uniref:AI-2E family transporter n=1 Tax=Inediibacterium massiliense TaxID=1658111 RepID=UPI0006B4A9EE|nr:AI-2E family transporter [Inediibacterium massiliense]
MSKPVYYLFYILNIGIRLFLVLLLGFCIYYLIHIGNQYIDVHKRLKMKKKYFFYLWIGMIGFLFILLIYHFRSILWKLVIPILWAIVFSYLLNPIVTQIDKKGIKRVWSVTIVYLSIIMIIFLISFIVTPAMMKETKKLVELFPQYTKETNQFLNDLYIKIEKLDHFSPELRFMKDSVEENLYKIQNIFTKGMKNITLGIFNIFSKIVTIVLIPIFSFYFLKDIEYFKKKIMFCIPKSCRCECIRIFRDIHLLLNKFIRGQFIVAFLVGILSVIALLFIQVDFAFLIGMIAGISNIIPYFGPIIGAVPGVFIALLDSPIKALWVILAFTIIQQIESAIITPKIVGESVGLHPITVILSLLLGGEWFGLIGLLFAVPIAAIIKIVSGHIMDWMVKG